MFNDELQQDLEDAKSSFVESLHNIYGHPLVRIESGRSVGLIYSKSSDWIRASDAFEAAINLLHRLGPRSLARDDLEDVLKRLSGLPALTASAALQAGKSASTALSLLEAGCGVIASLSIDLTMDLSDLEKISPQLFQDYTQLRDRLSSQRSLSLYLPTRSSVKVPPVGVDNVLQRRKIVEQLEEVERKIRAEVPGYQDFQQSPPPNRFMDLAKGGPGPIIAFNVTQHRSDAFIVTAKQIMAVPLTALDLKALESNVLLLTGDKRITIGPDRTIHKRNKELRRILKWLWDVAVRPVLQCIDLLGSKPPGRLPRIWWVTYGQMGLAPLHAAGCQWGKSMENTVSHVVSSYIPSFKALAHARERSLSGHMGRDQKYLIVAMPKTTGWPDLSIVDEIDAIHNSIEGTGIPEPEVLDTPTKKDVLRKLQDASVAHFICHGVSDPTNPSNSHLLLTNDRNGIPERLTVRDLAAASLKMARMAYLSACSTADNAARDSDEVIHLASTFLLAGFPHIIGTLWEANDESSSTVSQAFYNVLAKEKEWMYGGNEDAFAYAVHEAVNHLRSGQIEGRRTKKNGSENVIAWVPFIHMGC